MKKHLYIASILLAIASLIGVSVLNPVRVQAAKHTVSTKTFNAHFTGSNGHVKGSGTFKGTFSPKKFQVQKGHLMALGTLSGTLTDSAGNTEKVNQSVAIPVKSLSSNGAGGRFGESARPNAAASCSILHLVLGPINLNLLGLKITTNQIVLDISAQPGPGNLLGNLLCAVADLGNGGLLNGLLADLANLLNQILAVVQGV